MDDNDYVKHLSIVDKWSPEMSRKYVVAQNETLKIKHEEKDNDKIRKGSSVEENFTRAASNGDLKSLLSLMSKVSIDVQNTKGQTALILACLSGCIIVTRFLIAKRANIEILDHSGNSALHHACLKDDVDMLKLLIDKINPNIKNKDGSSILHLAIKHEKYQTIDYLIKLSNKINFDDQDIDGNTAVHLAIEIRNIKIFSKLLTVQTDLALYNKDGLNPLNLAVAREDLEFLQLLLKTPHGYKVFPNKTRWKESNFQMAVRSKFNGIVDFLLNMKDSCIIPTEIDEKYGYTCLHWATLQINKELIERILNKNQKLINVKDTHNMTVFEHVVNMYGKSKIYQNTFMDIANILLYYDADIDLVANRVGLKKLIKDNATRKLKIDL